MTIASLVILTLVFVIMGWTSQADNKSLLLFAAFMVVAISVAGGYNQSQKVTYIIGGSKKEMQNSFAIASIVGVVVVMALFLFFLDLPIMTVAIGFYLPISTTSIILVGALIRVFVEKMSKNAAEKDLKVANGISLSSGLVAGGSIIGLVGIIL